MASAFEHCAALVRERDPDRFFATLFAPPERRPLLHALYAFHLEIVAIELRAVEPFPAEIRRQWWRDVVQGERAGEASSSPVASALVAMLDATGIARAPLIDLLDAYSDDPDTPESRAAFAAHALRIEGAVLRAASAILGVTDGVEAALAPASVALAGSVALRNLAARAAHGRIDIPADLLTRHRVPRNEILAGVESPALRSAISEFRDAVATAASEAIAAIAQMPAPARAAFLHVGLVPLYLARVARRDYAPFRTVVEVPQWRRQWQLWRLARRLG
ncbi:MAG: squalene/phytoene synthase family protein [Rhizobiales bacterium]|nr:squalene/phytoene synthase family protein [Hyphomicrobiales bacterium]